MGLTPMSRVLLFLGSASLIVSGCGKPDASEEASPRGAEQEIKVETHEFRFSPRTIEFHSGEPLVVTLHNAGLVAHSFTTDDPSADVVVPPGEDRTVTLTPDRRVSFYCRFHQANGMQGALCPQGTECTPPLFP